MLEGLPGRWREVLVGVISILSAGEIHSQEVVGRWDFHFSGTANIANDEQTFWFGHSPQGFPPIPGLNPVIFEDLRFVASDQGKVFSCDRFSDPDFESVASLLVDGKVDWFGGFANQSSSASATERTMFGAPPVDFGGVDLIGYTLTSISLQFDQIGFGGWVEYSNYELSGHLELNGVADVVPEPSILTLGSSVLWWMHWRRIRPRRGT